MIRYWVFIVSLGLFSACAHQSSSMYYWGEYETLLYDMYHQPDQAPPPAQIPILVRDIEHAITNKQSIPPGVYAHLGFMYSLEGQLDNAINAFKQEQRLYPEAATLMSYMIDRAHTMQAKER